MICRHCANPLQNRFLDLGFAPPSNAYLSAADLKKPEQYFPLKVFVCDQCWLVQTEDFNRAEDLFRDDYAYFSSTSATWLNHAAEYVDQILNRQKLDEHSFVIEIASNDGYLLKNFVSAGIPCLGIEPTQSTAEVAINQAIPVLQSFFNEQLAHSLSAKNQRADLIIANNVFAHVPDINDFCRGLKAALKSKGVITLEFPHLLKLLEFCQFDTVYHEHFSYLSLKTVNKIFHANGLTIWDVEELPTHGGSLRIYGGHLEDAWEISHAVRNLLKREIEQGLQSLEIYNQFQARADRIKDDLLLFLIEQKRANKTVAAYGAAAKGNTILNYAGIKQDLLPFVCDAAVAKQNKYLPGSHIPIYPPSALTEFCPDYVLILPWNIASEVKQQNSGLVKSGTQFITAIPELLIV